MWFSLVINYINHITVLASLYDVDPVFDFKIDIIRHVSHSIVTMETLCVPMYINILQISTGTYLKVHLSIYKYTNIKKDLL